MMRTLFLYLSEQPRLQDWFLKFPPSRRFARRFVAGESLDEALEAIRSINKRGGAAALDVLGENVHDIAEARQAAAAYHEALQRARDMRLDCNISVKLTQMGLDIDRELCAELVQSLAQHAETLGTDLEVDMESSAYTDATLNLVERVRAAGHRIGVAIQAYLYRSEEDIRRLIKQKIKVRLVKGAYKEPPEIAIPSKKRVNENFDHLMRILLDSGHYPAIATHDPKRIEATLEYARAIGRPRASFEFQMLYGIRRDLQARLLDAGYRLRVYIPFGTHWYPYFMRRLAERPANALFLLRQLFRG